MLGIYMALIDDGESQAAFNDIVKKYEKKLYGYALGILHNSALAEEAVWESFFAIAKCFDKINSGKIKNIEAYMIITIKNSCYKIYNKEKKHVEVVSFENILDRDEPSFDEFNKYEFSDLCTALKSLSDVYQSVIAYMLYYEYSADRTAEIMGISRSTVYKYLNRAKIILCEKLGETNG